MHNTVCENDPRRARRRRVQQAALDALEPRLCLTTFNVTATTDAGPGSFRQAILDANASGGLDRIEFHIGAGGFWTILPLSPLPAVSGPTVIDATTQGGYAGTPLIQLSGSSAPLGSNGLFISGGSSTVKGLLINSFSRGEGIWLASSNNTVQACWVGTTFTSAFAAPNREGIFVNGNNNLVGGYTAADQNIVSGNTGFGISVGGVELSFLATGNTIVGNRIGVDLIGNTAVPNGGGIAINGATANQVGSPLTGGRNIISGNLGDGVRISNLGTTLNVITDNYIGVGSDGATPLPNGVGVRIEFGASGNTIGSTSATPAALSNVISGNRKGIEIRDVVTSNNTIRGNLIGTDRTGLAAVPNERFGIDIQDGSGNRVDFNVIAATTTGLADEGIGIRIGVDAFDPPENTAVTRNFIGLSFAGTPLGNQGDGVRVVNGINTQIGTPGLGNTISGNGGAGVRFLGGTGQLVDNRIGLDNAGTAAAPNAAGGVVLQAPNTLVRGNAISGNAADGLFLGPTADGAFIEGNVIGLGSTGLPVPNAGHGIHLDNTSDARIGGTAAAALNVISGNTRAGILVDGVDATGVVVQGNRIGTDAAGLLDRGNGEDGVRVINADGTVIGGPTAEAGNVISGNGNGINLSLNAIGAVVQRNVIGLGADRSIPIANGGGVITAGGATLVDRNLVSSNTAYGIYLLPGADGSEVIGNFVGVDGAGELPRPNGTQGIAVTANAVNVGGVTLARRNVVSGNVQNGIEITGNGNTLRGNYVGTNFQGNAAIPNGQAGIEISGRDNVVGGNTSAARNLLSGNRRNGVRLVGPSATGNYLLGNFIGTDATGTLDLGNGFAGVFLQGASANHVGANPTLGEGNLISGNDEEGILLFDGSNGNYITGNLIGTDVTGTLPLGNSFHGIRVGFPASPVAANDGNSIGFALPEFANTIAFNGGHGIVISSGRLNTLDPNSIHDNGLRGIALTESGGTPNDPLDADTGPGGNDLQNFPTITTALATATQTTVKGSLHSIPNANFSVLIFSNPAADPSGAGEGQTYLGFASVTTDAAGNGLWSATLPAVPPGHVLTAIATGVAVAPRNSSEFSPAVTVADGIPPTVVAADFPYNIGPNHRVAVRFSEALQPPLRPEDFTVVNRRGGAGVPVSAVTYDPSNNTATVFFGGILPDGDYRLTVSAAGVRDVAGNPLDGNGDGVRGDDFTYDFYFLNADANRDRHVDFNDLVILAQSYNTTGTSWVKGDFNYDRDVDFNDLVIMAQRYNTDLPIPGAPVSPRPATPMPSLASVLAPANVKPSNFSNSRIRSVPELPVVAKRPPAPLKPVAKRTK